MLASPISEDWNEVSYQAYGFGIQSDMALPELVQADTERDIVIRMNEYKRVEDLVRLRELAYGRRRRIRQLLLSGENARNRVRYQANRVLETRIKNLVLQKNLVSADRIPHDVAGIEQLDAIKCLAPA